MDDAVGVYKVVTASVHTLEERPRYISAQVQTLFGHYRLTLVPIISEQIFTTLRVVPGKIRTVGGARAEQC